MKLIRRDPTLGYLDSLLWVPKSQINVEGTKAALTFSVNDKRNIRFLTLYQETAHHLLVPREFWEPKDLSFPVVDVRPTSYPKVNIRSKITLDFKDPTLSIQRDAVKAMQEARGGILQLACGLGKTVCALELIAREAVPALIVVDNTQLFEQWTGAIHQFLEVEGGIGMIGDGQFDWNKSVVLSTYQTLSQKWAEFPQEARYRFGLIIWDECFPAGTLVDGRPIESLKQGDLIRSFSHASGRVEYKQVQRVFTSQPRSLVRVLLEDGQQFICTPGHPFFTRRGYIHAIDLHSHDVVVRVEHHAEARCMQLVPAVVPACHQEAERSTEATWQGLLHEGTRTTCKSGLVFSDDGEDKQDVCLGSDAVKESHALRGGEGEGIHIATQDGSQASPAGGQRKSAECSAAVAPGTSRLGTRVCVGDRSGGSEGRSSDALQDRLGEPGEEGGDRDRRIVAHETQGQGCRSTEDRLLDLIGVDRVEVLEPGGDGTYGGMCPGGLVYNIEVEDNHNYFVDDVLVHNCHHMAAPTWARTADLFYGKRIGLTATPERPDGTHVIYDFHLGKVLYKNLIQELKPAIYFYWTGLTVDQSDPKVKELICDVNGELHTSMLSSYFGQWRERIDLILDEVRKAEAQGRKVLVLSYSIAELVNMFCLWSGYPGLYTDVTYPTAGDVGETVPPAPLDDRTFKLLGKKYGQLTAMLKDPQLQHGSLQHVKLQLAEVTQRFQAHEVWKKCETEFARRQLGFLRKALSDNTSNAGLMIGAVPPKVRQKMLKDKQIVFAIMKYGREGLDEQSLDTVFVCEPMSQKNSLQQLMGRVLRKKAGKKTPVVVFFEDDIGPMIGMCQNLRGHLRSWPLEEGGPFAYEHVGHPRKGKRTTWNT